jgi:hypothetical protein
MIISNFFINDELPHGYLSTGRTGKTIKDNETCFSSYGMESICYLFS